MSHRHKIVIAEDDPGIFELLTVRLELAGYHTIGARDGYQAIDRIRHSQPSIVVLDIGMPYLDGFGVLEFLQQHATERYIPTLVLTARHSETDVQRAIGLGAADFLAKPFDDRQLLIRVARLVKLREQLDRERRPFAVAHDVFSTTHGRP